MHLAEQFHEAEVVLQTGHVSLLLAAVVVGVQVDLACADGCAPWAVFVADHGIDRARLTCVRAIRNFGSERVQAIEDEATHARCRVADAVVVSGVALHIALEHRGERWAERGRSGQRREVAGGQRIGRDVAADGRRTPLLGTQTDDGQAAPERVRVVATVDAGVHADKGFDAEDRLEARAQIFRALEANERSGHAARIDDAGRHARFAFGGGADGTRISVDHAVDGHLVLCVGKLAEKAGNQRGCGKCAMLHRMSPRLVFVCHHRVAPGGSMHSGNGCLIEWFRD